MKLAHKINTRLIHHPTLYALLGGIGVILFWRGIWLTVDFLMSAAMKTSLSMPSAIDTINMIDGAWWDGPLSLVLGFLILFATNSFVSSLIGNEIIISGLREEKMASEKKDKIISDKNGTISDIRRSLTAINAKLEVLEHEFDGRTTE